MKVLAATLNKISNTKMFSIMLDIPTVLLAELRTHRILTQGSLYEHMELDDFNMSANSARAIPLDKYTQKVLDKPFVPMWTKQQKGMSGELFTEKDEPYYPTNEWLLHLRGQYPDHWKEPYTKKESLDLGYVEGTNSILETIAYLKEIGVHKQNANRLLAPWAYTTCILSGTEWSNFFELRCPKYHTPVSGDGFHAKSKKELISWHSNKDNLDKLEDPNFDWSSINQSSAQPEFQVIAEQIYDLYCEADWEEEKYHIPFVDDIKKLYYDDIKLYLQQKESEHVIQDTWDIYMKISASMCAKLSYNTQENVDTLEKHLERADKLKESQHWEVFSHQAVAMNEVEYHDYFKSFIVSKEVYKNRKDLQFIKERGDNYLVNEYGWCYNNRGFISQRYILENL